MLEVILLEPIKKLGDFGDIVKVKPGFARNYLVAQQKALIATPDSRKTFDARKADLLLKKEAEADLAQQRIEALQAFGPITLTARAGAEGRLFGAITVKNILKALEDIGFSAEKKELELPEKSLKTVGEYSVYFKPKGQAHSEKVLFTLKILPEAV